MSATNPEGIIEKSSVQNIIVNDKLKRINISRHLKLLTTDELQSVLGYIRTLIINRTPQEEAKRRYCIMCDSTKLYKEGLCRKCHDRMI